MLKVPPLQVRKKTDGQSIIIINNNNNRTNNNIFFLCLLNSQPVVSGLA